MDGGLYRSICWREATRGVSRSRSAGKSQPIRQGAGDHQRLSGRERCRSAIESGTECAWQSERIREQTALAYGVYAGDPWPRRVPSERRKMTRCEPGGSTAMNVVIDANLALALILPLPYSLSAAGQVARWKRAGLCSMHRLVGYEVVSGLRKAVFDCHSPQNAQDGLGSLWGLNIIQVPQTPGLAAASLRGPSALDGGLLRCRLRDLGRTPRSRVLDGRRQPGGIVSNKA